MPKASSAPKDSPVEIAAEADLRYVNDDEPGISRISRGKTPKYAMANGLSVRDRRTLARIKSLAIPPAWRDVWICQHRRGHIQATGRDERGRKQYRYHPEWQQASNRTKFSHIIAFAKALPKIRRRARRHMGRKQLDREKVLGTIVTLLESTLIRVGNREYARTNGSFGLTTLQDRHATFKGSEVRFTFKGKTGKAWQVALSDKRVARIVRKCQDLPGQHLFQYEADGSLHQVASDDVNEYLREISEQDISAKDFRTWAATVLAALALTEFDAVDSAAAAKCNVRMAIESVAKQLGNTPTICRKCYVHPEILDCYLEGGLVSTLRGKISKQLSGRLNNLEPAEAAVLALLQRRLSAQKRRRPLSLKSALQQSPSKRSKKSGKRQIQGNILAA